MKELNYVIKSEFGVHARPAGHIAGLASGFVCEINFFSGDKAANAKSVLEVMGLALKRGDVLRAVFSGADENAASAAMLDFFEHNI